MAPNLRLDLSLEAFLTNDDGKGKATLMLGVDGAPIRHATDLLSGEDYAQVCANIPTDTSEPKAAKRRSLIDELLKSGVLVSVSGHGVWAKVADVPAILNTLK